jgi:dTDP-4-amino-4,6-dideoxygalactose transaminase
MAYSIPLFDLNYDEAEEQAVQAVLRDRWISTGTRTVAFEERFAAMLGTRHAIAVTNCTCALHMAMLLAGVGPGDEVLVPSLTFVATVNAVRYVGATPVFCDIVGCEDLTLDATALPALITSRTKAIVVMHYGGFPCDMERIMELARRHGLIVIEDACHGPLSEYQGRRLGTIGAMGCFSFFANKSISTAEGGMLVTDNDEYARRARLLRSHGMTTLSFERAKGHATEYDVLEIGYNYRLDDVRAALGLVQLEKLPRDLAVRAEVRVWYLAALDGDERLTIPVRSWTGFVSNYIFIVVLRAATAAVRDKVRAALHERGIQTSVHFPAAHRFGAYAPFRRPLPHTEYVADALITLPMYAALTRTQVGLITDTLRSALP